MEVDDDDDVPKSFVVTQVDDHDEDDDPGGDDDVELLDDGGGAGVTRDALPPPKEADDAKPPDDPPTDGEHPESFDVVYDSDAAIIDDSLIVISEQERHRLSYPFPDKFPCPHPKEPKWYHEFYCSADDIHIKYLEDYLKSKKAGVDNK